MKEIERTTFLMRPISEKELILEAGTASAKFFLERVRPQKDARIVVVAGPGNNGLDALVMGRRLKEEGFSVKACLFRNDETREFYTEEPDATFPDESTLSRLDLFLREATHVIDGLFGTGLHKPVEGIYKQAIDQINSSAAFVYSVDIPSGICGSNGLVRGAAVKADLCGAIGFYKTGNLLGDAMDHQKEIGIVPVDFVVPDNLGMITYLENPTIPPRERPHNSHKYDYGTVLTIGGSPGMFGSVQLAAMACLRVGVGLSSIAVERSKINHFSQVYAEPILKTYHTLSEFFELTNAYDAFLFGPGMKSKHGNLSKLEIILQSAKPVVLDATGLELVSNLTGRLDNLILTPHVGEMARICSVSSSEIREQPLKYVEKLTETGATVVLKGAVTIVSRQNRTVLIRSGNPGMATAGMGDVLGGIILGMTLRFKDPFDAALYGVLIHSEAGNLAEDRKGMESLIASDLFETIPEVIKKGEHR